MSSPLTWMIFCPKKPGYIAPGQTCLVLLGFLIVAVCIQGEVRGENPVSKEMKEVSKELRNVAESSEHHEGKDNPFKGNIDLSIWTFGVFLLLLGILGRFAWPKIVEGLEKREQSISLAMQEARAAQDEAASLRAQLQKDREVAAQQLRDMMEEARRTAQQLKEEMKSEAQAEIKSERDRLHREIATAQDQALQEIWKKSSELATLISTKVVRRSMNPDDHRRLVDEALAEMQQATDQRQKVMAGLK